MKTGKQILTKGELKKLPNDKLMPLWDLSEQFFNDVQEEIYRREEKRIVKELKEAEKEYERKRKLDFVKNSSHKMSEL